MKEEQTPLPEPTPSLSTSMDNLRTERALLQQHIQALYETCKRLKNPLVEVHLYIPIESEGYPIVQQLERELINLHYLNGDLEKLLVHLKLVL